MAQIDPLLRSLRRDFSQALIEHKMLVPDDHVMVGLSGGKDSWALLGLFADLRTRAPFRFTLSSVMIDGGLVGLNAAAMEARCKEMEIPFHLIRQDIFATVAEKKDEGSKFCSMCAKLRRGALYGAAETIGATKIALGHHLDDAIETLFLNLFYGGRTAALPPVLISHGDRPPILRPLLYIDEARLAAYARAGGFPITGCVCPVCPTHPEHESSHMDLKRRKMKELISQLAVDVPNLRGTLRAAMSKVEIDRFFDVREVEKKTHARI